MKKQGLRVLLTLSMAAALLTTGAAAALPETLVPVGSTVGIRLDADGLLVVGFDESGDSAAKAAGMRKGDVIKTVNGLDADDSAAFRQQLARSGGQPLELTVERDGAEQTVEVTPKAAGDGYRLGVYLRDSMAGIGTVTYYDPTTGAYGALGHGVNDLETMVLLPLEGGEILPSSVAEVRKGVSGNPGILKGAFNTSTTLGTVETNTDHGIFGVADTPLSSSQPLPVAKASDVHTGKATVLCNVRNTAVEEYEIEVTKLFDEDDGSGRNMLLTISDPRLLQTTGGIVQGMSGAPLIQDGKLIGAVTHVLVNDPTRGYGILIENMLASAPAA